MSVSQDKKWKIYNKYNPISVLAIRPALKIVDAHNHPIRGGIAAAIASGLAHYLVIFLIVNAFFHQDMSLFVKIPIMAHIFIAINMISNLMIGITRYKQRQFGNIEQIV